MSEIHGCSSRFNFTNKQERNRSEKNPFVSHIIAILCIKIDHFAWSFEEKNGAFLPLKLSNYCFERHKFSYLSIRGPPHL